MNRYAISLGASVLAAGVLMTSAANAAVIGKAQYGQAVGAMCQGALPNFEGSFRKRPLGISNEGSASAFLTCGLSSQYDSSTGGVDEIVLYVTNRNAPNTDMSCTLVDGYVDATIGFTDFFPQTINVVGLTYGMFDWTASGSGGTNDPVFGYPAISCNVPANFEVNIEAHAFSEEVGA
jgi:hypothetical protein